MPPDPPCRVLVDLGRQKSSWSAINDTFVPSEQLVSLHDHVAVQRSEFHRCDTPTRLVRWSRCTQKRSLRLVTGVSDMGQA